MMVDVDIRTIEQYLYREARLADEHDYAGWESLWTDDALYWVPAGDTDGDPVRAMAVVYDNRNRISTRIRQLETGRRHSQAPPSNLRRVVSNVEILAEEGADTVVAANFVLVESRQGRMETWAGRTTYRIRVVDGALRLAAKKVELVNRHDPLPTLSFLI